MTKKAQKAFQFYKTMIAEDMVYKTWTHEDYDDVTVYEDINGDIVCVQRDDNDKIVDVWIE